MIPLGLPQLRARPVSRLSRLVAVVAGEGPGGQDGTRRAALAAGDDLWRRTGRAAGVAVM